jgi:hypothetical protein
MASEMGLQKEKENETPCETHDDFRDKFILSAANCETS